MPKEFYTDRAAYKASLEKNLDAFKHDGSISVEAGQNVARVLTTFDPQLKTFKVDVAKTVNMSFQQKASQKYK